MHIGHTHVCMEVCIHVCIHIWMYVHACMYKHACTYMNTHMHTHTWIHPCSTHTHTYIHQHIHKCMCALCIPYIACVCTLQLLVCDHIPWQRHTYTPMHAQVPGTTKVCTKARSTPDHLKMARWTPLSSCSNIDAMHQPTPRQKKSSSCRLEHPIAQDAANPASTHKPLHQRGNSTNQNFTATKVVSVFVFVVGVADVVVFLLLVIILFLIMLHAWPKQTLELLLLWNEKALNRAVWLIKLIITQPESPNTP